MADELVTLRVKPRSAWAGLESGADGLLVVRVRAPAVAGEANEECLRLLARALETPKSAIEIARGHRGRVKQVSVKGISAPEVKSRLERISSARRGRKR